MRQTYEHTLMLPYSCQSSRLVRCKEWQLCNQQVNDGTPGERRRGKEERESGGKGKETSCHKVLQGSRGGFNLNWIAACRCFHDSLSAAGACWMPPKPSPCTRNAHTQTHTLPTHLTLHSLTPPGPCHRSTVWFLALYFSLFLRLRQIYRSSGSFSLTRDEDPSPLKWRWWMADWRDDPRWAHSQTNIDMQRHSLQLWAGNMKCGNHEIRAEMLQLPRCITNQLLDLDGVSHQTLSIHERI